MRAISKKRRAQLVDRIRVRLDVVDRADGRCEARELIPSVDCGGPMDVHEVIPRSAWPDGWLIAANCKLVCRRHHHFIDDNPDTARTLGLHGSSWDRPDGHCGLGA